MSKDRTCLDICNRGLANQHIQVEQGNIAENFKETCESAIIEFLKTKWWKKLGLCDVNDPKTVVYTWYPLSLGNLENKTFNKHVNNQHLCFFRM